MPLHMLLLQKQASLSLVMSDFLSLNTSSFCHDLMSYFVWKIVY